MNIQRGDIWLIKLDPIIGSEQGGTRPVVILSVNIFNSSKAKKIIIVPLSTKSKGVPLDVLIQPPDGGLLRNSYVKCEDVRSISVNRFVEKWGELSLLKIKEIEEKLQFLLGL